MLFLYSGFGPGFTKNIKNFTDNIKGQKKLALLLQGGDGYEKYIDNYLKPLNTNGVVDIEVVVPENRETYISQTSIDIISNADAIFIGGGSTEIYCSLYCTEELKRILHSKYTQSIPFAGLSAGSKIMNDLVHLDHCKETKEGLALVREIQIFPHFEENSYAYKAITYCLKNSESKAYGLETDSYLAISNNNTIHKNGDGKVFILQNENNNLVTIKEFF